jgi:hypothetical protein
MLPMEKSHGARKILRQFFLRGAAKKLADGWLARVYMGFIESWNVIYHSARS